ncbi:MAG: DNA repair protein RecO [Clostridia bacterium]|nr:DNA repair protein RecO [Clostridia bacterium]
METIKVKALVLSSCDYKEKDKLVTLFTLENGVMTATLKSVKSSTAKFKYAKEPFCFGEFLIAMPSKVITGVEVENTFFEITKNIDKFYIACAILETIKTVVSSFEPNPQLFVESLKAIGTIAYDNVNDKYVLIKYLLSIFSGMGYRLEYDACSVCGQKFSGKRYLNLDFGEVVCTGCKTANCLEISPRTTSTFKILSNTDYDKLGTVKLSGGSDDEALNVLNINFDRRFSKKLNLL